MRRRDVIAVIYGAALALPCGAAAQQAGKAWRIGHVGTVPPEQGEPFAQALEPCGGCVMVASAFRANESSLRNTFFSGVWRVGSRSNVRSRS